MPSFQESVNQLIAMPYAEKLRVGRTTFKNIVDILSTKGSRYFFVSAAQAAVWYYALFSTTDRRISRDELTYFNEIAGMNMGYDEFYEECTTADHPEVEAQLRNCLRNLSEQDVSYFQLLAALVYALKPNPTYDEIAHLAQFFF